MNIYPLDIDWCKANRVRIQFYDAYGQGRVEVKIPGFFWSDRDNIKEAIDFLKSVQVSNRDTAEVLNGLKFMAMRLGCEFKDHSDDYACMVLNEAINKLQSVLPKEEEGSSGIL